MTRYGGWEGILEEGETILWQGRPTSRFRITPSQIVVLIFGIGLSGIAAYWMVTVSNASGPWWVFGLGMFFLGIILGLGPIIVENTQRKNSWYTLTDKRAFIGSDMPLVGRRLKSYPINSSTVLEYRNEDPPSLYFAVETKRGRYEPILIDIGFVGIPDASDVLRLMRGLQGVNPKPEMANDRRP